MNPNPRECQKVAFALRVGAVQNSTALPGPNRTLLSSLFVTACWIISGFSLVGQVIVVNDSNGDGVSDGPRQLLPNTADQQINLYVTGGPPVQGLNFNVQVADGFLTAVARLMAPI
jgi:hypothetical protein